MNTKRPRAAIRGLWLISMTVWLVQATLGQEAPIKGTVKDITGRPLPAVKITLTDLGSGNKFTLKSNKEGKFVKFGVPPAEYTISAQLDGYFPYKASLSVIFEKEENLEITLEKIPPKLDDDKDFQEGVSFFKQGRYGEAVEYFAKVAVRFPESAEARYNLGVSELRGGKTDEAIADLEKTVELKPDLTDAYFALGECYFSKGENEKAIRTFSRTLEIKGQDAKSYYNLGIVYYKLGKVDEAISSFEKSIELEPAFSSAYYQAGVAYIKKGDLKKALQYLERFLKQEPNAPEAAQVKTMIEELNKRIGTL
jgi:tetratricopeptide (TPR) repeat protein